MPASDPELEELKPKAFKKVNLDAVRQLQEAAIRPDLTTIVVIGDTTPDEAKAVITKWFGTWKAEGAKPDTTLPAIPVNKASAANVHDPQAVHAGLLADHG